jgi:hypothetical protein
MPRFRVCLAVASHRAVVGSTEDVIEGTSAEDAERLALEPWKQARPELDFRRLLTTSA